MFALLRIRFTLSVLLSLLLFSGCGMRGSVRMDPAEREAPIYGSSVVVSEDIDPPAALSPPPAAEPPLQEEPAQTELQAELPEEDAEPVPLTREELIGQLTQPVYFALDDASLSAAQAEQLDQLAEFLIAAENSQLNLRIEGHCDDRGTREYNFALGARRAAVIAKQLTEAGLPKDRLKTISYGKERLAYSGVSEFARARNRRGELMLKPVFKAPETPKN
ncbi:MAG: hypothetical protein CMN53_03320 [SAR116 cluster bacterium]|nr:hypothetical protein [SAR116 cluster bacterium]